MSKNRDADKASIFNRKNFANLERLLGEALMETNNATFTYIFFSFKFPFLWHENCLFLLIRVSNREYACA